MRENSSVNLRLTTPYFNIWTLKRYISLYKIARIPFDIIKACAKLLFSLICNLTFRHLIVQFGTFPFGTSVMIWIPDWSSIGSLNVCGILVWFSKDIWQWSGIQAIAQKPDWKCANKLKKTIPCMVIKGSRNSNSTLNSLDFECIPILGLQYSIWDCSFIGLASFRLLALKSSVWILA